MCYVRATWYTNKPLHLEAPIAQLHLLLHISICV